MKQIYSICPYTYYRNEQFMKDCILLPYTFSKIEDFQTVIVTAQKEEYTYLELLPGLITEIVPPVSSSEQWVDFACSYIRQNYNKIDILFCFGSYVTNQKIIPLYKSLHPKGKVILKLDINSGWADRLSLSIPDLRRMYDNCDLITCESKCMKKLLSEKWPYRIEYVTNGYLEDVSPLHSVDYNQKEKTILTVGRLGSKVKANHILLEAFAKCAETYSDWKIKLVGSIEPEFQHYIEDYYRKHPELSSRVIFTGKISNKEQLNEEYRKAKIFAMTSVSEGGTPNVFSEAARNGCYIVSSEIDAVDEMTYWGQCGKSFPINDLEGLIRIFEEILDKNYEPIMRQSCEVIQEYHRRYFDFKRMAKKLLHLLSLSHTGTY
jgi:GalNAc-alpha-(1->4)-GalNAc-alpha-(1->3)-diNAcBac-PP-undecaprenol alpha-1,4-N-acetyl-D-galactosaminyltransferase